MPGWEKTVPKEDVATVLGMVTEKEWVPSPTDLCTDRDVTAVPGAGQDRRPACCRPAQARALHPQPAGLPSVLCHCLPATASPGEQGPHIQRPKFKFPLDWPRALGAVHTCRNLPESLQHRALRLLPTVTSGRVLRGPGLG